MVDFYRLIGYDLLNDDRIRRAALHFFGFRCGEGARPKPGEGVGLGGFRLILHNNIVGPVAPGCEDVRG